MSIRQIYGIFRAVVADVNDPKKLDRVRVRVPEILGGVVTDWVWPKVVAPGWSWKPRVNEPVWVQFENGDIDRPLYCGCWYPATDGKSTVPDESQAEYPFHRMIKTPDGHKIEFKDLDPEDENSAHYVRITSAGGHVIELMDTKDSEKVTIKSKIGTADGHEIVMDAKAETIAIKHKDGITKIEIDSAGKLSVYANSDIEIKSKGAVNILGADGVGTVGGVVCAGNPLHQCAFNGGPHPAGSQNVKAN